MSKIFKRICAYLIDILLITTLTQSLASTTIFNPNLNKYQKYQKLSNEEYISYATVITDFQKYYSDNKLTEKEYNKIIEHNPNYTEEINKYWIDNKLTEKNYNKLIKDISKKYNKNAKKNLYLQDKNSISEKIIYLIIVLLYFIGFNYITAGQTLGKKIMKLKIVNVDEKEKVSILSYSIRTIMLYQTIYYITRLIAILSTNATGYSNITNIAYSVQNMLDLIIMSLIIIRTDGRGLHDILAKTKVISTKEK